MTEAVYEPFLDLFSVVSNIDWLTLGIFQTLRLEKLGQTLKLH